MALGEIYQGIKLTLKADGKSIEKIFAVRPGADPKSIKLTIENAKSLKINKKGELEAEFGFCTARFSKPLAYQKKSGKFVDVKIDYYLEDGAYGFVLGNYDKSAPLIIDPSLNYATYLGGSDFDSGGGIAVDSGGNVIVTGQAKSPDFPVTSGALTGNADVFIAKLNPDGTSFSYVTLLGGDGDLDAGADIKIDDADNIYITGHTDSTFNTFAATSKSFFRQFCAAIFTACPPTKVETWE